jgi:putative aminopeptidase FrvX
MDVNLLKNVLSIPSVSRFESDVRDFLISWAQDNNINYRVDEFGNLFMMKGESESYPCVVAHMDTVHRDQKDLVGRDKKLHIVETTTDEGNILYAQRKLTSGVMCSTGIGGDDKAGVFIVLELLKQHDSIMAAFFIEEEIGCLGSKRAIGDEWLEKAGYFIQFDAPTDDWISKVCSNVLLFDDNFEKMLEPVWDEFEMSKPSISDPFTDIKELRRNYDVNCINYFAGYMDMHSPFEYVVLEYVEKAINLAKATISTLGTDKYLFKK